MFGWLRKRTVGGMIASDTKTALRALQALPLESQQGHARIIIRKISEAVAALERAGDDQEMIDRAIKNHLLLATQSRQATVMLGAKSDSDPSWAAAAVIEGWMMGNSGELGRPAFEAIHDGVVSWVTSVLSPEQVEEEQMIASGSSTRAAKKRRSAKKKRTRG